MTVWHNFNDAENQASFELIPAKTLAKVRMTLKPGGCDNPHLGWIGGYATRSPETGAAYLAAEFVVLEGPYAKRKVWSLIGLHSEKGPTWANMGRTFLRAVLHSARGIHPDDPSPQAHQARCIQGFADLDGIEFVARIDVERDQRKGEERNVIHAAIEPNHKDYAALMGGQPATFPTPDFAPSAPAAPVVPAPGLSPPPAATGLSGRPAWAQ